MAAARAATAIVAVAVLLVWGLKTFTPIGTRLRQSENRRLIDEPKTLEELSQVYNVSRERVRQIEVRAFEKLQDRMRELAGAKGMSVPA